ncbi:MAG: hypothetical protein ACOX2B_07350 [Syntrophothermaceae bacterium]|jgi:hypothetical protein
MNKKVLVLLMIMLLFVNIGCSSGQKPNEQSSPVSTRPSPKVEYPTEFYIGDTLVFPNTSEITVISTEFATRVNPPNPDSFYTYYEVKDPNKIYVHSTVKVKNLKGNDLDADQALSIKVVYDGQYEYSGFSTIEETGGRDFNYTNISSIEPLTTGVLHFLNEVPLEVKESGKPIKIIISANGKTLSSLGKPTAGNQTIKVADEALLMDNTTWQSYTPVTLNTAISVAGYADFTISKAEIASRVNPPKPRSFYTYYEVKDNNLRYAHLAVNFKNTMNIGKDANEALSVRLIYDNKYEYNGFSCIEEDGGGDFTYSNITRIEPLTSGNLHYLIEVPADVELDSKPLIFIITANGQNYYYQYR